jgi:hypothetical protein
MKQLQHIYETSKTLENTCVVCAAQHVLVFGRIKARWRVEFTEGSGLTALIGNGPTVLVGGCRIPTASFNRLTEAVNLMHPPRLISINRDGCVKVTVSVNSLIKTVALGQPPRLIGINQGGRVSCPPPLRLNQGRRSAGGPAPD